METCATRVTAANAISTIMGSEDHTHQGLLVLS
jgi:hypothetical protein